MNVAFLLGALVAVVSALQTIRATRLVHGVLWLGLMLGATAVVFVLLGAPFLASIQLLLYVGGVMTLMIFGLLLTRSGEAGEPVADSSPWGRAAVVAIGLLTVFGWAVTTSNLTAAESTVVPEVSQLGQSLLTRHLLSFEILSALLLAAMIGAIVLARRRDPVDPSEAP